MAVLDFLKGAVNTVGNGLASAANAVGLNTYGTGGAVSGLTNGSVGGGAGGGGGSSVVPTAVAGPTAPQAVAGPNLSDVLAGYGSTTAATSTGSSSSGVDSATLKALLSSGQAQLSALQSGGQLAQSQADQQKQTITDAAAAQLAQAQKLRDATLNSAGQRESFLNTQYQQNQALGNQAYDASTQTANEKAQLSLTDIDSALAQTLPTLDRSKTTAIEDTEQARNQTEDTLRRQFEGRNAVDSTFYGKAAAEATAGLYRQRNDQIFQIDQAITTATTQAASQKRAVQTDLNSVLRDLEVKKNQQMTQLQQQYSQGLIDLNDVKQAANLTLDQFASESEIQKIGQLQQISFNLDNYMQGLNERQADVRTQLAAAGATGIDYSANTGDANAFIQQLAAAKAKL